MKSNTKIKPSERLCRVIEKTEIRDVFLRSSRTECYKHFSEIKPDESELNNTISNSWLTSDDKSVLGCFVKYEIFGQLKGGDKALFKIECVFVVEYLIKDFDTLEEADLNVFINTNAYFNAYPYIRQHIQNESLALRIAPIVLPFLKPLNGATINKLFSDK